MFEDNLVIEFLKFKKVFKLNKNGSFNLKQPSINYVLFNLFKHGETNTKLIKNKTKLILYDLLREWNVEFQLGYIPKSNVFTAIKIIQSGDFKIYSKIYKRKYFIKKLIK